MSLCLKIQRYLILATLSVFLMLTTVSCIGPRVKTETLVVNPGIPVLILERTKPQCLLLDKNADKQGEVNITGWIAISPDDYRAFVEEYKRIQEELKNTKEELRKAKELITKLTTGTKV